MSVVLINIPIWCKCFQNIIIASHEHHEAPLIRSVILNEMLCCMIPACVSAGLWMYNHCSWLSTVAELPRHKQTSHDLAVFIIITDQLDTAVIIRHWWREAVHDNTEWVTPWDGESDHNWSLRLIKIMRCKKTARRLAQQAYSSAGMLQMDENKLATFTVNSKYTGVRLNNTLCSKVKHSEIKVIVGLPYGRHYQKFSKHPRNL